ncbi:MAG: 50S ribosomal protein L21 [Nitrososphaerota archaeon]|nr:50S ribosomal protein L21 [Nitrososphaerota archaeon]MDG6916965.1 50S ribosomal protein L21 [Nitrososphaerota archaeon]MDG6919094.1 50S ribosomal protein L21 [Nitrososphaerota archaeon]
MPKSHGIRRRTRSLLRSSTKKGLSSLLVEYSPNDKVVIKIDPTQVKGMPHRRFNGLVGTVTEVGRRAVTVDVMVGDKVKKLIARKEHVVKMGGT